MSSGTSSSTINPSTSISSSTVSSTTSSTVSTINYAEYEAILIKYLSGIQKAPSAAQIKAEAEVKRVEVEVTRIKGEARNKTLVICMVYAIAIVLAIFGCYIFVANSKIAKDVWVIIGPIITASLTGTTGYLTGEKQASKKE